MSDTTTAPAASATEATPPSTESAPTADATLGEAGQKALKAERDARSQAERSAKALQAQLDALQASQMSDLEKANKAAQDAQAEALKATNEALRYRYAAKHGISDEDAETFLTGTDEETIAKQAERLAAKNAPVSTPVTPRVATDPSQGGGSAPPALNSDALEDALKQKLGIT